MSSEDFKRLFFALSVKAPWPDTLPQGRITEAEYRHITTVFLGRTHYPTLVPLLEEIPKVHFTLAPVALFDECLFLPNKDRPRVVAWHVDFLSLKHEIIKLVKEQDTWCSERELIASPTKRDWLPHVTLCRKPFYPREWKKAFQILPLLIDGFHLYESMGNNVYQKIWGHSFDAPFENIDHTADFAFKIVGQSIREIYLHAQIALAFIFPILTPYITKKERPTSLDQVIVLLNEQISQVDIDCGSPIKAVSYHGQINQKQDNILEWEMIIDV